MDATWTLLLTAVLAIAVLVPAALLARAGVVGEVRRMLETPAGLRP